MPPDQAQNKTSQDPPDERSPAIRTMKSDVDEFFKVTKPTVAQMISRREQEREEPAERRPRKIILTALALTLGLGVIGGGVILIMRLLPSSPDSIEPGPAAKLTPPAPFFATETSRTINVNVRDRTQFIRLLEDSWREKERQGTVKRIIIKIHDGPQERFATLGDFLGFWHITPPGSVLQETDPPVMVFIYYGAAGSRLGFAVRSRLPDRTLAGILSWEPALPIVFTPLFFDEKISSPLSAVFEDRIYRNIDWRYLKLSQDRDLGIAHSIFPVGSILIFTTSKEAMETSINRLFDAR